MSLVMYTAAVPNVNTTLREARTRAGFTQEELAQRARVSRQHYVAVEAGRSVPSTEVALRLARSLNTTVEELFSLSDAPDAMVEAELLSPPGTVQKDLRVQLARVGHRMLARPLLRQNATVHVLAKAEGLVVSESQPDKPVTVHALDSAAIDAPTLVMVGCDPAVAFVAAAVQEHGVRLIWSEEGSRDAVAALARGEAHVAGCHLLDERTGEYNLPLVHRLVHFPCTVVGFAVWRQGLIVAAGNLKDIRGIQDLARSDVSIVNRQEGSGSRNLLDRLMRHHRVPVSKVSGYGRQVRGHLAVAEVVASGFADAGVGVEAAARAYDLGFVPLDEERYDLIIPNEFLETHPVRVLLDALNRGALRRQIEALGGYDLATMGLPVSS